MTLINKINNFIKDIKIRNQNRKLEEKFMNEIFTYEEKLKSFFIKSDKEFKDFITDLEIDSLIKTTSISEKTIDIADGILENKFFLMNSLDIITFEDEIDWNYKHDTAANTYRLYIQCLNVISHLCDAFIETKEKKYILKAYSLLLNWIYFIKVDKEPNRFKWVDHSVANRVLNIIYFYHVAKHEIDLNIELIIDILIEHGEFLENDKNYNPNNHGIMVDRSLLVLSVFLSKYESANRWFQKSKLRLTNAMYRDFSANGVHLENSPSYHLMTRKLFNEVEKFLQSNNKSLGKEVREKLSQTRDYIAYMVKPDYTLPLIGDTSIGKVTWIEKSYESFSDTHAGITILQSKADKEINSTWLSFICGYGSKTHKHRDDLSITLFYNGKDILIDSGRYNYDSKDKYRQYFLSPESHSTLNVVGKEYEILEPFKNRNKIKTVGFITNKHYDYVKGINHAYPNIKLSRAIVFFKPNIIFIHDTLISKEKETIEQIFNFAPNVEVKEVKNDIVTAISEKDDIVIKQLITGNSAKEIYGDLETPRGIISEEFSKIIKNSQVIFSKSGTRIEFLTLIAMNLSDKQIKSIEFDRDDKILNVEINNKNYSVCL